MTPQISVILPAYNASKYLLRAVTSILSQTYTNFELIVIDDGSKDNTWELINSVEDSRLVTVRLPENKGLIWALNYGFEVAKGEYIARMDADDISLPTRLKKQFLFLRDNPEYGACGTAIYNFNEKSQSYLKYPKSNEEILTSLFLFERNICHPTVMIRSSIIKEHNVKYKKEYPHAEDFVLWHDLITYSKLFNLDEALLKYSRHENQVSSKYYSEQLEISRHIVTTRFLKLADELGVYFNVDYLSDFLIHERGGERLLRPDQANNVMKKLYEFNRSTNYFDKKSFNRIIKFKRLVCALHYNYDFEDKLKSLMSYILSTPGEGVKNTIYLIKLFLLARIKK